MGNLQKATKQAAMSGILDEIERSPEDKRIYDLEKHAIDYDKTYLNYSLVQHQQKATEYLRERLEAVKCMKRDDIKVLGQWVWTMPKDLAPEHQEEFFRGIYEFYADKHGKENICYAQVHLDETTPHMHIGIIPIAPNKKGVDRVCAKEVFNREYLQKAHSDLQAYLEDRIGQEVNLLNGETLGVDGIKEFKALKDLKNQSEELTEEIELKKAYIKELDIQIADKKGILAQLTEKIEALKEKIESAIESLRDHPNMYQMFLHWLTKGQYSREEEREVLHKYDDHLEELRQIRHRDDGPSL